MLSALAGLLLAGTPSAGEHHEHRRHGAHVHGVAQLNGVQAGRLLVLELVSPATDIVGFERAPRTPAEQDAVHRSMTILGDARRMLVLPDAADCAVSSERAVTDLPVEDGNSHDHDHDHGHAEFHMHYEFECDKPEALQYVDLRLFVEFPATRRVEVQFVTPRGQTARILTPDAARIAF